MPSRLLFGVRAAKPNKAMEKINRTGWVKLRVVPALYPQAPETSSVTQCKAAQEFIGWRSGF